MFHPVLSGLSLESEFVKNLLKVLGFNKGWNQHNWYKSNGKSGAVKDAGGHGVVDPESFVRECGTNAGIRSKWLSPYKGNIWDAVSAIEPTSDEEKRVYALCCYIIAAAFQRVRVKKNKKTAPAENKNTKWAKEWFLQGMKFHRHWEYPDGLPMPQPEVVLKLVSSPKLDLDSMKEFPPLTSDTKMVKAVVVETTADQVKAVVVETTAEMVKAVEHSIADQIKAVEPTIAEPIKTVDNSIVEMVNTVYGCDCGGAWSCEACYPITNAESDVEMPEVGESPTSACSGFIPYSFYVGDVLVSTPSAPPAEMVLSIC